MGDHPVATRSDAALSASRSTNKPNKETMTCATETMTCTIDSDLRVRTDSCTEVTSSELYDQGQLKLAHRWSIWYDRGFQKGLGQTEYQSDLQKVGTFDCISDFWRYWNSLELAMPKGANLRIFKDGIMPTWEDPLNEHGGRWTLAHCGNHGQHTEKDTANILEVLLWLVGCGSSVDSDLLCGMVFSRRSQGTVLSVWNTNAKDASCLQTVSKELAEVVGCQFKYKQHFKTNGSAPPSPQMRSRKSPPIPQGSSLGKPSKSRSRSKTPENEKASSMKSSDKPPRPRSRKNSAEKPKKTTKDTQNSKVMETPKAHRDFGSSKGIGWDMASYILLGATATGVIVSWLTTADWAAFI